MAVIKIEYREPGPEETLHHLTQRIEEAEHELRRKGWREMPLDVARAAERVYHGGSPDNLTWFTKKGYLSMREAKRVAELLAPLTKVCHVLDLAGTNFLVVDGGDDSGGS